MVESQFADEINQLTVDERLLLVQELWDGIAADQESLAVTVAQKEELDRRLDDYDASPEEGSSWDEVKQRVVAG
jgi:putative addiction module component (TIGR02574 family)